MIIFLWDRNTLYPSRPQEKSIFSLLHGHHKFRFTIGKNFAFTCCSLPVHIYHITRDERAIWISIDCYISTYDIILSNGVQATVVLQEKLLSGKTYIYCGV
jgi:hypothetical protein